MYFVEMIMYAFTVCCFVCVLFTAQNINLSLEVAIIEGATAAALKLMEYGADKFHISEVS